MPIRRVIFGTGYRGPDIKTGRIQPSSRIESMLSRPSWSVRSMLPHDEEDKQASVTKEQLHHLLKLSALPQPRSQEEEDGMLKTLESQIHFVKEVQKVNTTGVEPLVALRDETAESFQEQTITLDTLKPFLDQEEKVGNNGTIRRRKPTAMITHSGWDPFELGDGKETRKMGKYFFVKKGKDKDNAPPVLPP